MYAQATHISPVTTICRNRVLPVPGRVIVRKGQKVNPNDVIAEGNPAPSHLLLDVARGLGLSPDQADRHLQRNVGDEVDRGDVLAGPIGIARRVVRAPQAGKVILAGSGQVLMEVQTPTHEVKAGMPGVVVELISNRGAQIETTGALIQGRWGNGGFDYGLAIVLARSPQDELTYDQLDVSLRGSVIVGVYCREARVLEAAAELPLRGLILASLDSSLVPLARKMSFPIVLLDGFGPLPMNSVAYRLLSTSERREMVVNALPWDHLAGTRPELIIPLPSTVQQTATTETKKFAPGQVIRVTRSPYHALTGTLAGLRPGKTRLPNGLRAPAADVHLENGEIVVVPLANLEVIA